MPDTREAATIEQVAEHCRAFLAAVEEGSTVAGEILLRGAGMALYKSLVPAVNPVERHRIIAGDIAGLIRARATDVGSSVKIQVNVGQVADAIAKALASARLTVEDFGAEELQKFADGIYQRFPDYNFGPHGMELVRVLAAIDNQIANWKRIAEEQGELTVAAKLEAQTAQYVPHEWVCPQCGYVHRTLDDGAEAVAPCPNDGTALQRQTWEERAREAMAATVKMGTRAEDAEREHQELVDAITFYDADLDGHEDAVDQIKRIGPDYAAVMKDARVLALARDMDGRCAGTHAVPMAECPHCDELIAATNRHSPNKGRAWTEDCKPEPPIVLGTKATISNAVHQHADASWGFFDARWGSCLQPFATKDDATEACKKYAKSL